MVAVSTEDSHGTMLIGTIPATLILLIVLVIIIIIITIITIRVVMIIKIMRPCLNIPPGCPDDWRMQAPAGKPQKLRFGSREPRCFHPFFAISWSGNLHAEK